jgi:hypothetical protein
MKKSEQLNKFYRHLTKKFTVDTIDQALSMVCSDSAFKNSDRGKWETELFERGFKFAKKMEKGEQVYYLDTGEVTYYFRCRKIQKVIDRIKKEFNPKA